MVVDNSLVHLDYKLNSLAAILAAILDSGDQFAKPTSIMVLHPLTQFVGHRERQSCES